MRGRVTCIRGTHVRARACLLFTRYFLSFSFFFLSFFFFARRREGISSSCYSCQPSLCTTSIVVLHVYIYIHTHEEISFSIFLKETLRKNPLYELIFLFFSLHGQLVIWKIEFLTDQTTYIYIYTCLKISRPDETKKITVISPLVSFVCYIYVYI